MPGEPAFLQEDPSTDGASGDRRRRPADRTGAHPAPAAARGAVRDGHDFGHRGTGSGLGEGRWGALVIKLGEVQVEQAAASLKRFAAQIDASRSGSPAFLAVICGKGYGYRRSDGVVVVPIGALGPWMLAARLD